MSRHVINEITSEIDWLHFQVDKPKAENTLMDKTSANSGSVGVFPEKVWEAILDRVGSSKAIQNVFLAFPKLQKSLHKKKGDWLFGLVLPHLMTKHLSMKMLKDIGGDRKWIQSKELLNLRLVSKRWKNCVDGALQNKANQYPSLPTADPINFIATENHFNYLPLSDYHLGMTIFHNAEQVDKFMKDMVGHQGNPFPGKSVWIQPVNALVHNSETLIAKCLDLFGKFGWHVEVLELEFFDRGSKCHLEMSKNILKCLSFMPNLRSLIFKGQFEGQDGSQGKADVKTSKYFENPSTQSLFPNLPKLESFTWQVLLMTANKESNWTVRMIQTYGKGEKLWKLGIEQDLYWSTVLASNLMNLTELDLFYNDCFEPNLLKLEKVLGSLPCGQKLRKFGLKSMSPWDAEVKVNLYELITILANFQIESLVLEDLPLEDKLDLEDEPKMEMCAADSITSLVVEDNMELSYEFLKMLPNLRFLTVHQSKKVRQETYTEYEKEFEGEEPFARKLRKAIVRPSVSGMEMGKVDLAAVWDTLPKLEMIRGSVQFFLEMERGGRPGYNVDVQYVRECGEQTFFGRMPEWDPMQEQWLEENEEEEEFWW